eukprot:scaffold128876_cov40-Prasinocladus_malaysianus.AAC.1
MVPYNRHFSKGYQYEYPTIIVRKTTRTVRQLSGDGCASRSCTGTTICTTTPCSSLRSVRSISRRSATHNPSYLSAQAAHSQTSLFQIKMNDLPISPRRTDK